MRVRLSVEARADRREAEAWYRDASPDALSGFRQALKTALEYIADYPEGAPLLRARIRGRILIRYPYTVYYEIHRDHIRVLTIADQRRDPAFYSMRLS